MEMRLDMKILVPEKEGKQKKSNLNWFALKSTHILENINNKLQSNNALVCQCSSSDVTCYKRKKTKKKKQLMERKRKEM